MNITPFFFGLQMVLIVCEYMWVFCERATIFILFFKHCKLTPAKRNIKLILWYAWISTASISPSQQLSSSLSTIHIDGNKNKYACCWCCDGWASFLSILIRIHCEMKSVEKLNADEKRNFYDYDFIC